MTNLAHFNNSWYYPGAGKFKQILWYITNSLIFNSYLFPFSSLKTMLLKLFGAKIGKKVVIKPNVNIKYAWNIEIGDYSWIGENVWMDSLDKIIIGKNVCISQGVYLLTGNHNYKKSTFDLIIKKIIIEEGAWIGAKSIVIPGAICKKHSILTVGSVSPAIMQEMTIYRGNPAVEVKKRMFES